LFRSRGYGDPAAVSRLRITDPGTAQSARGGELGPAGRARPVAEQAILQAQRRCPASESADTKR
jgi:hypothetical protein